MFDIIQDVKALVTGVLITIFYTEIRVFMDVGDLLIIVILKVC